jgi:metallopeptidase MepB
MRCTKFKVCFSCTSIAQDIFHTFFENDPWSHDAWKRYREGILEFGGSQPDQMKMLQLYLGREPDFHALTKSLTN